MIGRWMIAGRTIASVSTGNRRLKTGAAGVLAASILLSSGPAMAQQQGEARRSVGGAALDAVTQPLSDLNLRKREIPEILLAAQTAPYILDGLGDCTALHSAIDGLDEVLGPDANEEEETNGALRSGLKAGGGFLAGFIPFRGVVRQISGAKQQESRWNDAIYAGVARRAFLKGYGKGIGCKTRTEEAVNSATDVLGLGGGG